MKISRGALLATVWLLLTTSQSHAHHSFAAVFDPGRTITVTGIVTQFRFINPHALIHLDVTDDQGKVQKWTVEAPGRHNLSAGKEGWTEKSVSVGERVTITGNPKWDGSTGMSLGKLIRADGTQLKQPGDVRQDLIEEERQKRRASQQKQD